MTSTYKSNVLRRIVAVILFLVGWDMFGLRNKVLGFGVVIPDGIEWWLGLVLIGAAIAIWTKRSSSN